MKHIQQPKYRPVYQLPYCCVPATLQWILYRRGLDIMDQEMIGAELGLRLPEKGKGMFQNRKISFLEKCPRSGWGTQIEKQKYSIGSFFSRHNIPLRISKLRIPKNPDAAERFLTENISKGNDIILRFHNSVLQKSKPGVGHFAVICEYDSRRKRVVIGDPEPPFFKTMSIDDLLDSISNKIDGVVRGFYTVSSQ